MVGRVRRAICLLLLGCSPATPPSHDDVNVPSATSAPLATPPPKPPAPASQPMPPVDALKLVFVQSMQGGPSEARCNQIQFEITLEMDTGAWTYASCDPQPGDPSGKEPLRPRKGTLTPQRRASVEVAYAKMTRSGPRPCAADAGRMNLRLTRKDGTKESFADEHTACGPTAPEIAMGLREFASALVGAVLSP
jgi:hypothetical protein